MRPDADNADQRVKWFLKVYKTYKLLCEAYYQFSFFPKFSFRPTFYEFFHFHSLENEKFTFPFLLCFFCSPIKFQVSICYSLRTTTILKRYRIFHHHLPNRYLNVTLRRRVHLTTGRKDSLPRFWEGMCPSKTKR